MATCNHVPYPKPEKAGTCLKCGRAIPSTPAPPPPREPVLVLVRDGWRVIPKLMELPE